jgi:glutamine amidotransferase
MQVTVIDYKAGNLTSVVKALRHLGAEVEVTDHPEPLAKAERIILPGVGHFAATRRLDDTGLTPAIRGAIGRRIPFLGICVGMQWLYAASTEAPDQPGLGFFSETIERFPDGEEKVPHVGWNQIDPSPASHLFSGVEKGEFAYFTHAWRAPITSATAATTYYIRPFASAAEQDNVFGVQFHPEKSGETGLKILKNFLQIRRVQLASGPGEGYIRPSAVSNCLASEPGAFHPSDEDLSLGTRLPQAGMTRAFGPEHQLERAGPC